MEPHIVISSLYPEKEEEVKAVFKKMYYFILYHMQL